MFRQKLDDLNNCSCRLIPNQSTQYLIFKTQQSDAKPTKKQTKEKFSLKNQTVSSKKHQNKEISAQKNFIKPTKQFYNQKFSILGKLDPQRKKIDKNFIFSPNNCQIKKLSQKNVLKSNLVSEKINYMTMQNAVQKLQKTKERSSKPIVINLCNRNHTQSQYNKGFLVSNFGNLRQNSNYCREIPKKSFNFEQYYKNISNPYEKNDKNKQNICDRGNPQIQNNKIQIRLKKQTKKSKNQGQNSNQINKNLVPQILNISLQKYESYKYKTKETIKESLMTDNTMNSHGKSTRISSNNCSKINFKTLRFEQNPSLQFGKASNLEQMNSLKHNFSQILTKKAFIQNTNKILNNETTMFNERQQNDNDTESNSNCKFTKILTQNLKKVGKLQNSQKINIYHQPRLSKSKSTLAIGQKQMKQSKFKQKLLIQKVNTFKDIIGSYEQCESVIQEDLSYNGSEQSVVIMRYKDIIHQFAEVSEIQKSTTLQPKGLTVKQNSKPKNLEDIMIAQGKSSNNIKEKTQQNIKENSETWIQNYNKIKKADKQFCIPQLIVE